MIDFEFSNPNDLSRDEFESRKKFYGWNTYTADQIANYGIQVSGLIQKGMTEELSEDDQSFVRIAKAELKDMQQIRVVENIDGRICKSLVFVQDPQIKVIDLLEKSVDGKPIQKGIFLDTPLNRELGRVGQTFEKGCKSTYDKKEDLMKAIKEKPEYGTAKDIFTKGMKDPEAFEELKKAHPGVTEADYKNFKKAYGHSFYEDLLEKAKKIKEELDKEPEDKGQE
jgi:hypothetical protein